VKASNIIIIIILAIAASFVYLWYSTKKPTPTSVKNMIIKIGTNAEYPPYTFIKKNKIVGFDIDIITEVFRKIKRKYEIKDMAWTALIPAIQLNQIQVIAAGITATPQREKHAFFTKPYIKGDPLLIVTLAKNQPINNVEELQGKKVLVDEGYTADTYMSKQEGISLQRTASPVQGFLALKSERADAYVIAKSSAIQFFEKYGIDAFHTAEIKDATESYSFVISKKHPELFEAIQKALLEMEEDGTIRKLKIKWKLQ